MSRPGHGARRPSSLSRFMRPGRWVVVFVILAVCAVVVHLSGDGARNGGVVEGSRRAAGVGATPQPPHRAVAVAENSRPGTDAWRIGSEWAAEKGEIEGYADKVTALPGERVRLFVSTTGRSFTVTAFRMGWYGGKAGRQVWHSGQVQGRRQPAGVVTGATHTVRAVWRPSLTVPTGGWPAGYYLLKLTADTGRQRYVPLLVRSTQTRGRVVLLSAVMTWQAYNDWGGLSLYHGGGGRVDFAGRSRAVSFDRPYANGRGDGRYLLDEHPVVMRAERLGVPLAYVSGIELATRPDLLDGATAVIVLGHDEYWTAEMKERVERARDAGTNVAFLGANQLYWRVRLEPSPLGPGRTVVGYKSARADPMEGEDDARVTARFRDPPAPSPENTLVGMLYECFPASAPYTIYDPGFWLFQGTGVRKGSKFPGLAGVEIDRVYPIPSTPRPIQVVSHSPAPCYRVTTYQNSVYYTVKSGAGVFSVGTMRWTCALGRGCRTVGLDEAGSRFVTKVTDNLLTEFAKGPVGRKHPARDNLKQFAHLPTRNVTGSA
jgi:hypothetical protein